VPLSLTVWHDISLEYNIPWNNSLTFQRIQLLVHKSDIIQKIFFPFYLVLVALSHYSCSLLLSISLLCCAIIIHLLLLSSLSFTFSCSVTPFLLFLYSFHTFIFSPHFFPSPFPSRLFIRRLVIFLSIF